MRYIFFQFHDLFTVYFYGYKYIKEANIKSKLINFREFLVGIFQKRLFAKITFRENSKGLIRENKSSLNRTFFYFKINPLRYTQVLVNRFRFPSISELISWQRTVWRIQEKIFSQLAHNRRDLTFTICRRFLCIRLSISHLSVDPCEHTIDVQFLR